MQYFKSPEIPIVLNSPLVNYFISCEPMPNCQSKVAPLSFVTYTISFSPSVKGEYEYVFDIFSNSNEDYWIRIPIK